MYIEAANRVLDAALAAGPRCGSTHVIAIDGPTGSGKTTCAEALDDVVRARSLTCTVLHTDEVCPGWDGLAQLPEILESVLTRLATDGETTCPTWNWHAGAPGPAHRLAASQVLIIEGVGSGSRTCASFLSASVRLDAAAAVRKTRGLARDGDTFAPYWDAWAAAESHYFAAEWSQNAAIHLRGD